MYERITGKKISVTGKCVYGTRREMFKLIEQYGGIPGKSVTKDTYLLVQGSPSAQHDPSNKTRNALKYGITVMSENEFMAFLLDQK